MRHPLTAVLGPLFAGLAANISSAQLVQSSVPGVMVKPGFDAAVLASGLNLPLGMAIESSGDLLVSSNCGNCGIVRLSSTGTLLGTSAPIADPDGLAIDGAGSIYVAGSNVVTLVLSLNGGMNSTFASGFSNLNDMVIDSAGSMYVLEDNGGIYEVSMGSGLFLASIPGGGGLGLGPAPDSILVVASSYNGGVFQVSTLTGGVTQLIGLGVNSEDVESGPGGAFGSDLFISLQGGTVVTLDPVTGSTTDFAAMPSGIERLLFRGSSDLLVSNLVTGEILRIFPAPGAAASYCTAGTSASGCVAILGANGTPSATSPSGFNLTATNVEGQKDGLYFFGTNGRQANPWGSGTSFQCVVPPVARAGLLTGSGTNGLCDGAFTQDLNALWCPTCPKPGHNPGAGALVQAQLWYRDPQNTSSQTTSLSNAIEFQVLP